MGQELDCVILICNASVVLSHMFSGGPDPQDVDLGASHGVMSRQWGYLSLVQ